MSILLSNIFFSIFGGASVALWWVYLFSSHSVTHDAAGILYLAMPFIVYSAWTMTPKGFVLIGVLAILASMYDESFIGVYIVMTALVAQWVSSFILEHGIPQLDLILGAGAAAVVIINGETLGVSNPTPLLMMIFTVVLTNLLVLVMVHRGKSHFYSIFKPVIVATFLGLTINVVLHDYTTNAEEVGSFVIPLLQYPVALATLLASALLVSPKVEIKSKSKWQ